MIKKIWNRIVVVTLCCLCAVLVSCGKSDEDLIIGQWEINIQVQPGVFLSGVDTYNRDGTGTSMGTISDGQQSIYVVTSCNWSLDGDLLSYEVNSSNRPDLIPIGYSDTMTVVSVSKDKFVTKDPDGTITTSTRK